MTKLDDRPSGPSVGGRTREQPPTRGSSWPRPRSRYRGPLYSSRLRRPLWMGRPTPVTMGAKALTLVLIIGIIGLPFLVIVSTSLATEAQINSSGGYVLLPSPPTLDAYARILSGGVVTRSVIVSAGITLAGTAISMVATVLAAYALSRRGSLFHTPLLTLLLLTFLFTPGIIPVYLTVKELHLLDSYWSLILPVAVSAFNVVIVRGFFMGVPAELLDSARIDGASELRILLTIVIPLSRAVLAVVGMFYAVGYWNAFFSALLYLDDSSKWPLQLIVRTYVLQGTPLGKEAAEVGTLPPTQALQMAVVVLAILPIALIYPFVQRHLRSGTLTGAVKG